MELSTTLTSAAFLRKIGFGAIKIGKMLITCVFAVLSIQYIVHL